MGFTEEQRRRMEENRARAQARLREKRMALSPAGSTLPEGRGATTAGVDDPRPSPPGAAQDHSSIRNNVDGTTECAAAPESRKLVDAPGPGREPEPEPPAATEPGRRQGAQNPARRSTRTGGGGRAAAAVANTSAATNGSSSSSRSDREKSRGDSAAVVCEGCAGVEDDARRVDKELLEGFGVTVCRTCKLRNEDYQCVTKKEAKEAYLLPEGTIAVLKYIERDNPHHSSWTKMKLYLRRDVAGYSYKRWGSEEGLAAEKHRRDSLKYDRTLERTQGIFKRSRSETEDDVGGSV